MERAPIARVTDAASPVVGVVLMVTITVVCSTVVGAFAMGLSADVRASPPDADVAFVHDGATETLTLVHEGGDAFSAERVAFVGDVEGGTEICGGGAWATDGTTVSSGDACSISVVAVDHNVSVRWVGEDVSTTLGAWSGQDD